jgi:DNA-binding IclR family transcriptional regulator
MFQRTVTPGAPDQAGAAPPEALTGIDRVLASLKEVARHPRGARLEDLARALHSPKSSVHRALAALRRAGLVEHDAGGAYRLGLEFLRIAFKHYDGLDTRNVVEPALRALSERFGETAHYATAALPGVVYVAIVQSPSPSSIKLTSCIGGRNPAHCTGVGKALLACLLRDRAQVDAYVAAHGPLERRTSATLTSGQALHRELELSRERGYAVDREEGEPGVNCLSMPVYLGPGGEPSGAISISGIVQRTPLKRLEGAAEEFRAIAELHLGRGAVGFRTP